jgi:deoxyribodipyrimidine photolyase-like uncharacterized protein
LLLPLEICLLAEAAYRSGKAPLNATEGFIRQILGWREYVRGIYWLHRPDYAQLNFFDAKRPLPNFTGLPILAYFASLKLFAIPAITPIPVIFNA